MTAELRDRIKRAIDQHTRARIGPPGRARTPQAFTREIPHGTESAYTNRECRCDQCRAAYATAKRLRRARQRAQAAA